MLRPTRPASVSTLWLSHGNSAVRSISAARSVNLSSNSRRHSLRNSSWSSVSLNASDIPSPLLVRPGRGKPVGATRSPAPTCRSYRRPSARALEWPAPDTRSRLGRPLVKAALLGYGYWGPNLSRNLGDLWYLHSQRVNLGRIQHDINALWSIGPHDVSIANYLIGAAPRWVSARGARYLHTELEDVVFATLGYDGGVLAHLHVSWLDPSKVRRTTVVGSRRMVVFDDLDSEAKLRVYDKGADPVQGGYGEYQFRLRTGDIHVPRTELTEPLALELEHFLECCASGARPRSDGWSGARVVAAGAFIGGPEVEAFERALAAFCGVTGRSASPPARPHCISACSRWGSG